VIPAPLRPATIADELLAVDVFSEQLVSTDPSQVGRRLTEQLRELTGARTVMLIAHLDRGHTHQLVHVCPERRAALFAADELGQLCFSSLFDDLPRRPADLPVEHPQRALLLRIGVESVLRFPLRAVNQLLATLLLLDLPDPDRIDEAAAIVTHLSPVMTLALKNSFAHQKIEQQAGELERRVAERTAELEAANRALDTSRLAALSAMDEAAEARRLAEQAAADLRQEIVERRRVENTLRESDERFRYVFDYSPIGKSLTLPTGGISANRALSDMLGYSIDELQGTTWKQITHPDDVEVTERALDAILAGDKTKATFSKRYLRKDGSEIWAEVTTAVRRDSAGAPMYFMTVVSDITARKKAEEEKIALEAQLQQAQKMESVGRLAGGVAHDFNNMLGVIIGHAELGLGGVAPGHPLRAHLVGIRAAAERSADLARQLLAFARKQTVTPRVLDLNATVAGSLKMLERLIGEEIRLEW
jgi:PAS domain S-box-containing protein